MQQAKCAFALGLRSRLLLLKSFDCETPMVVGDATELLSLACEMPTVVGGAAAAPPPELTMNQMDRTRSGF